jgi:hypothetical protein
VLAAYGWSADISDDALLANLLALNLSRASAADSEGATDASESEE